MVQVACPWGSRALLRIAGAFQLPLYFQSVPIQVFTQLLLAPPRGALQLGLVDHLAKVSGIRPGVPLAHQQIGGYQQGDQQ